MDDAEEASLELEAVKGLASSIANVSGNQDGKKFSWVRSVQLGAGILPVPPSLLSLQRKERECI